MKRIDDYLENFYTGVNSEEVYELKNEIKDHLLELVQEFVEEGIEENKAISMAIEQFDDGPEMQKEILTLLNIKLQKSNRTFIKVTTKVINMFKIIFFISILIYGLSIVYCGFAQHKVNEYNQKINKTVNQLIKDNSIYNETELNKTLDKLIKEDSNIDSFWIRKNIDKNSELIYEYSNSIEHNPSYLHSTLQSIGIYSQLSRMSSERDDSKITLKGDLIKYVLILKSDGYSLAKTVSNASIYLSVFSIIIYLILFKRYKTCFNG